MKNIVVMITSLEPYSNYSSFLVQEYEKLSKSDKPELVVYAPTSTRSRQTSGFGKVKPVWQKGVLFFVSILSELFIDRPKIVHFQYETNMFGGALTNSFLPLFFMILRIYGFKIVITQHAVVPKKIIDQNFVGMFRGGKSIIKPELLISFFNYFALVTGLLVEKVIVHTNLLKKWLTNDYGVKKEKVEVLSHGVKIINSSTKERSKDFFYFGYFARRKGIENILRGFAKFIQNPKYKNTKLIMGGGVIKGQEFAFEEIKNLIKKLKLTNNVNILGFLEKEQIEKQFSRAYCCVIPAVISISASGPLAQAFGFKKCVIASKIGNYNEEITHKVDGYLTSNSDWDKAFLEIAENPQLVKEIETNVAKKAVARSWKKIAEQHRDIYQQILLK